MPALGALCVALAGCGGYMGYVIDQWGTALSQGDKPSAANLRKLDPLNCQTVYGVMSGDVGGATLAVVAFSDTFGTGEVVDVYQLERPGYYSLYLPAGRYRIAALADFDNDGLFENTELAGWYRDGAPLEVAIADGAASGVIGSIDFAVRTEASTVALISPITRVAKAGNQQSAYYPPGSMRSLDDPIFDQEVGQIGIYDPPAFLARAGIYFYALQERDVRKTPVVFVHGIGGSPREFRTIVESMDRDRFDPWFFYYPSGQSLDKSAELFAEIFFSGNIIKMRRRTLIVVAHSMGGLVVRAAINRYGADERDHFLKLYVSMCTPYGGSLEAAAGVRQAPVVVPSWRDIAADSPFMTALYQRPIPDHVDFRLLFGYRNSGQTGQSSDGVITMASQLDRRAQMAARGVYGFDETHTSVLESREVIGALNALLDRF